MRLILHRFAFMQGPNMTPPYTHTHLRPNLFQHVRTSQLQAPETTKSNFTEPKVKTFPGGACPPHSPRSSMLHMIDFFPSLTLWIPDCKSSDIVLTFCHVDICTFHDQQSLIFLFLSSLPPEIIKWFVPVNGSVKDIDAWASRGHGHLWRFLRVSLRHVYK